MDISLLHFGNPLKTLYVEAFPQTYVIEERCRCMLLSVGVDKILNFVPYFIQLLLESIVGYGLLNIHQCGADCNVVLDLFQKCIDLH